jgi:hypothetical protein
VRALSDARFARAEWGAAAAALGLTVLGRIDHAKPLFAAGAAAVLVLAIVYVPEFVLAVFLAAGAVKSNPALSGVPVDLTGLTAGCVVVAMLIRVRRDGLPVVPRVAAIYGVLLGLMLLSTLWSPDPATGVHKAATFGTLTLVAFLAPFVLIRTRAQMIRLMVAFVAVGLFVALTAVHTNHPAEPLIAAGSNEIELALYAGWGMLAALGYLVSIGRSPLRVLWLAPAALLALTVAQAGSRGVLAGGGLAIAFIVGQILLYRLPGRRLVVAAVMLGAIAVLASGAALTGGATGKYSRGLFHANLQSLLIGRDWILMRGWELSIAHPIGIGAGGFQWVTGWAESHNMFFEFSSELGMGSVVLVIWLIVAAWRARLRGPGGRSPESTVTGAFILLFVILALFTNGIADSRPLWFVLALALALPQLEIRERTVVRPARARAGGVPLGAPREFARSP